MKWPLIIGITLLGTIVFYTGIDVIAGYRAKNENSDLQAQAAYERSYRKYQIMPQPTIIAIKTAVDLFPEKSAYNVRGTYTAVNNTDKSMRTILVNFDDDFIINRAVFTSGTEMISVERPHQLIKLKKALLPQQKTTFEFDISYQWKTVNGHQAFNAIVQNGSFMRISRYYPQFGYLQANEIQDKQQRIQYHLGAITPVKAFNAPKTFNDNFIDLYMTVSTSSKQIAIGVGELTRQWNSNGRNYFTYKTTTPIPFRFALSSAQLQLLQNRHVRLSIAANWVQKLRRQNQNQQLPVYPISSSRGLPAVQRSKCRCVGGFY